MSNLEANTANLENLIKQFNDCVIKYNQSIDSFFTLIAKTKAWEGDDAKEFLELCASEKPNYTEYGETLVKMKNCLEDIVDSLKSTIKASGGNK